MSDKLGFEAQNKHRVPLLFLGNQVRDISSDKAHRKDGTDFLLAEVGINGWRGREVWCENKFERYASGRQTFELVSLDRSRDGIVPGWMYTSRAAWLLSWFPSGELVALRMDEARHLVFANPARNVSTSANNGRYMSWSSLQALEWVVLTAESARWVDLRKELGERHERRPMLSRAVRHKAVNAWGLAEHLLGGPTESTPIPVSQDQLMQDVITLAPLDLKASAHAAMREGLPFLRNPGRPTQYVRSAGGTAPRSVK